MRLSFTARHQLDPEALRARIDARVRAYQERYPKVNLPEYYRWIAPTVARAEYRGGSAEIQLHPQEVVLSMELPFFARLYRSRIEEFVRREIDAVLNDPSP